MKNRLINLALAATSLVVVFLVAEGATRLRYREFAFKSFLGEKRNLIQSAYPARYDRDLGWVPEPGDHGSANVWNTQVKILENGLRSNGTDLEGERPILAVGDSFTFCDQVSDDETWPAALSHTLGRPVLNGGVFGYGLDQAWLRAEQLMAIYHPEVLVFSFIPDDIKRCELSVRSGISKPYYRPVGNELVLENSPVPRPFHATSLGWAREIFGYSYLVHRLMMRTAPDFWLRGSGWRSVRAHTAGLRVACRLLGELDEQAARYGVDRVVVLVQYGERMPSHDLAMVDHVLACVDSSVTIVDLRKPLRELLRNQRPDTIFNAHMTPVGNRWVAAQVRAAIKDKER